MNKINRVHSHVKPNKFITLREGLYLYNYDIVEETAIVPDIQNPDFLKDIEHPIMKEIPGYNYIQVKLTGKPDYKSCVEAVIRLHISASQEFDLINTCNRIAFNMLSDDDESREAVEKYTEYLNKVTEIKQKVKEDFSQED